ncbi:MAG: NHLP leader peptide family RiPP precursor [Candidatus Muiribacteriota bacterium]
MADWTNAELDNVVRQIIKKSTSDKDFRNRVLTDSNSVVKELTGKSLPENHRIKFIENQPGVIHTVVLPDYTGEKLSDSDLDKVSGAGVRW